MTYIITFNFDIEHDQDADAPGNHCVKICWWMAHLWDV